MTRVNSLSVIVFAAASALIAPSANAEAPTCLSAESDLDGDGWGWENHRSCVVSNSAASTAIETAAATASATTASRVQNALAQFPVCSTTDSSSGTWGWENNRSCIVTDATQIITATEATQRELATAQPATPTQTPVCASNDADPDGDGWGWENNSSCIVSVTTQSVVVDDTQTNDISSTEDTVVDTIDEPALEIIDGLYLGSIPICSSESSDVDGDGWGFEYHDSCKIIEGYIAPGSIPDVAPDGNNPNMKVGIVYSQNFGTSDMGLYQVDQLNEDWQTPYWQLGFDQGRVSIVDTGGTNGNAMQVTYPAGRYGASGSSTFLSDVQFGMSLPKTYEELYVAYDIRFADDFDFVKGGKLPGLCGSDLNQPVNSGCNTGGGYPTGYDGWSARGMWREDGALENYIYHASQRNYYGDSEFWNVKPTPGTWHRVQHRVVLNTPGIKNGILEAWLDGVKVLSILNLEFRRTNQIGINLFYFSTFFGGNDASWAPATDQTMNFDNFVFSTEKID